jgi:hypothetical protein
MQVETQEVMEMATAHFAVHVTNIDRATDLYLTKPFDEVWKNRIRDTYKYQEPHAAFLCLDIRKDNPGTEQNIQWYSGARKNYSSDEELLKAVFSKPHDAAVEAAELSEGVRLLAIGGQHTTAAAREIYEKNTCDGKPTRSEIAFRDSYVFILKDDQGPTTEQMMILGQDDNLSHRMNQYKNTLETLFKVFVAKHDEIFKPGVEKNAENMKA